MAALLALACLVGLGCAIAGLFFDDDDADKMGLRK